MMKRRAIVVILYLQICPACYKDLCGFCVPGMMQRRIALYVSCIRIRAVLYEEVRNLCIACKCRGM